MKRIDFRIIIGILLVLGGLAALLEKLGIITQGMDLFWGLVFSAAGAAFLYAFFTDMKYRWWAAIPGFILLSWGIAGFLPDNLGLDGLISLGGIGISFLAVYLANRSRWWALIPAGVMITLGVTAVLSDNFGAVETGGVLFIGLGLTFLLVAVLAHMNWSFIPATVLIILGVVVGSPFEGVLDYVWIAALFLGGLVMVIYALRRK